MAPRSSLADLPGRVAGHHSARIDIAHRNRARADHRAGADRDMRADKAIGAQPGLVADHDGRAHQRHARVAEIMRSGTEMSALRNRHTLPDPDARKIVETDVVADRRPVADLELG